MKVVNVLKAGAAALVLATLAGCNDQTTMPMGNARHNIPVSADMMAKLSEKGVTSRAPMLIRAYKMESELEVWKQNASGEYVLVKTFPMCRWSGQLGPKKTQGDRQVPEGFYNITPGAMNPNSSFFLSFNVGYPNAYDRAHGRDGSLIMVHGACSSMGCFSMTDQQIADIYALARESFTGGQKSIQMQSYPFRFTPQNLAKFRADPNMPFWKMLKEGNDSFEVTKRETKVSVCDRKYVFNSNGSACAPDAASPIVQAVAAKRQADEVKVAELVSRTPAVRRMYSDGDQHPSFKHRAIAGVSQPEALSAGGVDVAVADVAPAAAPAKAAPSKVASASPRPAAAATASAAAFSPAPESQGQTSFFRKWLNTDEPAPAATTAAEAPKAAEPAAKPKADSKAKPKADVKAKPKPEKTADAGTAEPGLLSNFTALIPGWR
jgi:murein L,D-transpeptidase YafK